MKALTKGQQQWLWLVLLWCGGILGTALLATLVRTVIRLL